MKFRLNNLKYSLEVWLTNRYAYKLELEDGQHIGSGSAYYPNELKMMITTTLSKEGLNQKEIEEIFKVLFIPEKRFEICIS